MTYNYNLMN